MTHIVTFRTTGQLEGPSVWAEDAFESSSQHLCAGLSNLAGHSFWSIGAFWPQFRFTTLLNDMPKQQQLQSAQPLKVLNAVFQSTVNITLNKNKNAVLML